MPKIFALFLCTVFVLFLLRIDRKQAPDVSFALWLPIIWMLVSASKPLAVWFGAGGSDMEAGSPLDRVFHTVILIFGLLILARRQFNWFSAVKDHGWLLLLLGYMLLSTFWSDMLFTSFKRWTRELVAVVMAFLISTEREPRQAVESFFRRKIYILIPFSLLLVKYYPHLGVRYSWAGNLQWTGVALQKNGLALLCLFSSFFLVWTLVRRWKGRDIPVVGYQTLIEIVLLIMTAWLFTGPQHSIAYSATSTAALAVGLTAFGCFLWMKKQRILISPVALMIIIAIIIVYGTITPFLGGLTGYDVASTFGRDQTLTGRADIWKVLVPYAMKQPILGYGFGGFWTDAMRKMTSSHAHNGNLDIILNLGLVGLILFSIFLISSCRKARKVLAYDFDWGVLWICYLLMAVVHNIAESSMDGFTSNMSSIILILAVSSKIADSNTHGVLHAESDSRHMTRSKNNQNSE